MFRCIIVFSIKFVCMTWWCLIWLPTNVAVLFEIPITRSLRCKLKFGVLNFWVLDKCVSFNRKITIWKSFINWNNSERLFLRSYFCSSKIDFLLSYEFWMSVRMTVNAFIIGSLISLTLDEDEIWIKVSSMMFLSWLFCSEFLTTEA